MMRHRNSTRENYFAIWRNFNQFFIKLDCKPNNWEDRILLYVAFLIKSKKKSTTIKSYMSALKAILVVNKIKVNENKYLLASLTRACQLKNDTIKHRFPIHKDLLSLLLKTIQEEIGMKDNQPDLAVLYQAIFASGYYGLLRSGELTKSEHIIKAKDVHIGINKNKIMFMLHTSKTHNKGDKPQIVKIKGHLTMKLELCPFTLLRRYFASRRSRCSVEEQFFIFKDHSPVLPSQTRLILYRCLQKLNINSAPFSMHGLRASHACDMLKVGISVEMIKNIGRWKSNAVYTYLQNL